jgi:tetratricopeptide (TPR) repeat protein
MSKHNQHITLLGKVAAYTEIMVKDPGSTIFVSLAETYRKLGMFDEGQQILVKGLKKHPDLSSAHIVMARILCQLEDYSGSSAFFTTALKLDPDSLAALVGYARVKILLEESDQARKLLLHARSLSPADPVINKLLLSLPEEPLSLEPDNESAPAEHIAGLASVTLAQLYEKQGLLAKALDMYRQLSAKSPDDLMLRRKIKDLETDLGENQDTAATASVDDVNELSATSESGIDSLETMEDSKGTDGSDAAVGFGHADTEAGQVVKVLTQWLDNIQHRREHV